MVLYNPSKKNINHLNKLNKELNVIAWKNSSINFSKINFYILNNDSKKVKNIGLSEGMNQIIKFMSKKDLNNRCVTLLDQDTLLSSRQIIKLQKAHFQKESFQNSYIVPEIIGSNGLPWKSWFGITNGMTLTISDLIKVGGFDANLFADCADIIISDKLRKLNYKKIVLHKIQIKHSIGDKIKESIIPNFKESFKQKSYIKLSYFFHQSKIRRAMKVHSYLYVLSNSNFLIIHPLWSIKKIAYLILNIKDIGIRNTYNAIKYGIKKKAFPFHKIR